MKILKTYRNHNEIEQKFIIITAIGRIEKSIRLIFIQKKEGHVDVKIS